MSLFDDFAALHRPGAPLILFNVWDPGSAKAVAESGAPAIATGSWSVAVAQGFGDGEDLPFELFLATARRIVAAVALPVTIDFEGGYAVEPEIVAANAARLAATGAVGCNFEDRVVGGEGLHGISSQAARIAAIRAGAGPAFFINARTDLFLGSPPASHARHVREALDRAEAYAKAGANGFFAPGLADPGLIGQFCAASPLPVNIMAFSGVPDTAALAALGVARISYGPAPYRQAMQALTEAAAVHYR